MPVVKLSEIVEAMEMQSEMTVYYLNKKTGEIISVGEEDMDAIEDDDPVEEYPDWQQENIKAAREIQDTDDYIPLPSQFDIHEYEIMERFCLSIKDKKTGDGLYDAIKSRGAFRRFKDQIRQYGIEERWHQFKDAAYRRIAKEWCEENKVEYTEN